jgi:hypothetical protein
MRPAVLALIAAALMPAGASVGGPPARPNVAIPTGQQGFQPPPLGVVVQLPLGKGTLTLRATRVAGRQVADVRAAELVLKKELGVPDPRTPRGPRQPDHEHGVAG